MIARVAGWKIVWRRTQASPLMYGKNYWCLEMGSCPFCRNFSFTIGYRFQHVAALRIINLLLFVCLQCTLARNHMVSYYCSQQCSIKLNVKKFERPSTRSCYSGVMAYSDCARWHALRPTTHLSFNRPQSSCHHDVIQTFMNLRAASYSSRSAQYVLLYHARYDVSNMPTSHWKHYFISFSCH